MAAQYELLTPSLTPALPSYCDTWQDLVFHWIRAMPRGRAFQFYDLVELGCPDATDVAHSSGAVMSAAAKVGLVKCVGAEPSKRPTVRGSLTRVWERIA